MTRFRKYSLTSLCLASALILSSCQMAPSENGDKPTVGEVLPPTLEPTPTPLPFEGRSMRIALCTSPGTIDDQGRNSQCYEGILSFFFSRGNIDSIVPLQETSGDPAVAPKAFEAIPSAYDVMIFVGSAFSAIGPIAQENPNTYFILVDAPLTDDAGNSMELDNVCALEYAEQDCGFLAGVAAAMETQSGRVAVINEEPDSAALRYYYGFRSGVAYANGNFGTSADVIEHPAYSGLGDDGTIIPGNYTAGSDVTAYALSNSLLDEGCDILFVAAGDSGVGAINAVKGRPGNRIIGAETDQYLNGVNGIDNVVLTSVVKDYIGSVSLQLQKIAEDTFQGGGYTLHTADNATRYVSADDRQQLKPETLDALMDTYSLMQNNTIVPMSGSVD